MGRASREARRRREAQAAANAAPPPPPPPSRWQKIIQWFKQLPLRLWGLVKTPAKFPAVVLVLYSIYTFFPDNAGRIAYWIDQAKNVSWLFAIASPILTSPLFNVATLGVAILWLLFVGEPKQTLRHPILRIVGWAFVGLYASIVIMTATAGYVVANFGPRHLEDWQKKLLAERLVLPEGIVPQVVVVYEMGCSDCRGYGVELRHAMSLVKGWENTPLVNGTVMFIDPHYPLPVPIEIDVKDPKNLPPEAKIIVDAFAAANIKFELKQNEPEPPFKVAIAVNPR